MKYLLFVPLVMLAAASASAMTPETEAYLRKIGLDPQSAQVRGIASDAVKSESGTVITLDSLAAETEKTAVLRFVTTRNFVKAYLKNPKTPWPPADKYDLTYFSAAEVDQILNKLQEPFRLA